MRCPGRAQEHVEPDAGEGEGEECVVEVADVEVEGRTVGDEAEDEQAQAADDDLARERARVVVPHLVGGEGRAHPSKCWHGSRVGVPGLTLETLPGAPGCAAPRHGGPWRHDHR